MIHTYTPLQTPTAQALALRGRVHNLAAYARGLADALDALDGELGELAQELTEIDLAQADATETALAMPTPWLFTEEKTREVIKI